MSRRSGPGSGPRRAPSPRSGDGRRGPGTARRAGAPSRAGRLARGAAPAWSETELERQPPAAARVAPPVALAARPVGVLPDAPVSAGEPGPPPLRGERTSGLSGLALFLDQLDALLRDPTLTRALRAFAGRLAGGVRELATALRAFSGRLAGGVRQLATALAARAGRLVRAVAALRLPFPRRLLLALLVLLLPLALLALLSSSNDRHSTRGTSSPATAAVRAAPPAAGPSLAGVAMPALRSAPDRPPPVNVALVVDHRYDAASLRRELRALGSWLERNHAPGTRVSVIDAISARSSAPTRAADLAGARETRQRTSTASAIRAAFAASRGRRLLVTLGSTTAPEPGVSTLRVATRAGAREASSIALRRGRRARVTIDERRPDALAASVARAMMALSGQREQR